jgi:hypothetical protein
MALRISLVLVFIVLTVTALPAQEIDTGMTEHAKGTFDVALKPLEPYNTEEGASIGRMSLDKIFHGDLEAVGKGEMLTAMTDIQNSAGYVAVERIAGTLNGRKGTFAVLHRGIMTRGAPELIITVVPDSGTDELTGLSGTMTITITEGKHIYDFEYTFK